MSEDHPPNLALLKERAPTFWRWVQSGKAASVAQSPHGTLTTLVVDGIHLASAFAPHEEAAFLLEQAMSPSDEELWVYGTGSAVIEAALSRVKRLNVVGLSASASWAQLSRLDCGWTSDPRVRLFAPEEVRALAAPRVLCSAELRLAEPSAIRDAWLLHLVADHQKKTFADRSLQRLERANANRAGFPNDPGVRVLFEQGRPWAAVAAGGPSLGHGLSVIQSRRSEMTLICVSTALATVEAAGMAPDVVVVVDPSPALAKHFEVLKQPERLREVPLVYALDVDPSVLAAWPGPRHAARLQLADFAAVDPETDFGTLACSGTVTHTAIDLAREMGATDIVMLGADFSFPAGKTHAAEAAFVRTAHTTGLEVIAEHGGRVATSLSLLGYLRDLEAYIDQHPEVRFWNTSLDGAHIEGAQRYHP